MVGMKIEGDLSNVGEHQLGFIKEVIEKRGFKDANVVFAAVGKPGDNYVANVKRIIVEENGTVFKMIAKVAPQIEAMRMMTNVEIMFRNEVIVYTKILPKFEQLQASADVPLEERLRFAACYGCNEAAPNEVILLEDLKESGFEMLDRFKSLSGDCVRSVLKDFASLHSLSYVLKHKESDVFEEYKNSLIDMWSIIADREELKLYFSQVEASATMVLENDSHKKIMNGFISNTMKFYAKLLKTDSESKHSVVIQGDSWTNNIMFKFNNENQPTSIMIDYQASRAANPVSDLQYMIFNCTDYRTRKEHFYEWIDYYHDQLDKNLSMYGMKANYVYPRDQLDADLKRLGKLSLTFGVLLGNTLIKKADDVAEMMEVMKTIDLSMDAASIEEMMKSTAIENSDPETLALFKTKITELVDSHLELGYL